MWFSSCFFLVHRHASPFCAELENPLVLGEPEQLPRYATCMRQSHTLSGEISSDPCASNLATVTEATLGLAGVPGHSVVLAGFCSYLEAQNCVAAGGWPGGNKNEMKPSVRAHLSPVTFKGLRQENCKKRRGEGRGERKRGKCNRCLSLEFEITD